MILFFVPPITEFPENNSNTALMFCSNPECFWLILFLFVIVVFSIGACSLPLQHFQKQLLFDSWEDSGFNLPFS